MSEEASYYLRFISFFIDVGTETALQVVNYCTNDVESHLSSRETRQILRQLLQNRVLTRIQYNLATAPVPNPTNFDISLLITILCNTALLPPPNRGWENRPNQRDLSLSADILRLRNIRNSVVAHRSRAALPKYKFDRLWKELEEILLRITAVTAPGKKEELIEKIEYYGTRNLDAQKGRRYLQKLEEWWGNCEEVSRLQEKVEELVQKCNEFALFFRDKPEEYSCYVKLLLEGGRLVLSNFLMKQISEQGHDLRKILLKNRDVLEHPNEANQLFHTDSTDTVLVNTDTDSWDIFVLAHVIETILKPKDMEAIQIIKEARINYAETALMTIHNRSRFSVCYGDLIYAIRTLSQSLDKDIQEKCKKLISTTDVTSDDYLGQLKSNGLEIKNLSDLYKETLEKLKKSMNEMADAGICFKNDHVLDLKMITLGENAEKKRMAEETLYTVWQAALKLSENQDDFGAVRQVVDRILEDIRNIPGVQADGTRKGSLLFSLRCCSCNSLVQIIDYLSSERFQEHMDNLSRELGYIRDAVIRIEGHITFESLHNILDNPQNCAKVEERGFNLPIICSSPEGMRDVFKLLGNEKTRNNINQISDGLSAQVGETISVELLPDLKGFTGVFDDTDTAVSGQKSATIFGLKSNSSSEKHDHSRDPCLTIDQHKEAPVSAEDFGNSCDPCLATGQLIEANDVHLKHDQFIDLSTFRQEIPETHSEVCTEKCHLHKDQEIRYFCQQHEELGCDDCRILNHSTCHLDYLPYKFANIGVEYKSTSWLLDQKMYEVKAVVKKATIRGNEIDICHQGLIKEINQFQKEINDRIDHMRNEIQKEADKKNSSDKAIVQCVLDTCTTVSTDISNLQSSLHDNKTTKQNGQLYIAMKQAMSTLKSDEIKKSEEVLKKTDMQYRFEPDQNLQKVLSKIDALGNLSLSASLVTQSKKLDSLIHKENINIKTKSDKDTPYISGCAVLSSNKLVLADYTNNKLKVLDTQSKQVVKEKKLDSFPHDITTLPQDQIAVTMPGNKEILIMTTDSKLSTVHTIPIKGLCRGITCHQDHLFVVCRDPNNVVIIDTKGNVHNTIPLNNDILKYSYYIVVSEDSKLIYISDIGCRSIVSITLQGEISAVNKDLHTPGGMLMLGDGSLLVSCWMDGTIHHIAGDLKQGQQIIGGLQNPGSICYNHHQHEVYIGGWNFDQLAVLSMKYKMPTCNMSSPPYVKRANSLLSRDGSKYT